jgi:hypothetical protein
MGTFSAFLAKMTPHSSKLINKLGEIDYLEDIIHNAVSDMTEAAFDIGVATGGSSTTIVDTGKVWDVNLWQDSWFSVTIAGKEYQGKVTSNTADTITIPTIAPAVVVAGCAYKLFQTIAASNIKMINSTVLTSDDWTLRFQALNDNSVTGLMKSIGDIGAGDNVVTILGNILTAVGLLAAVPTVPTLYNVSLTDLDTEYSQALAANTKRFAVSIIDGQVGDNYRIAYVTGKVATPTAPYLKYEQNIEFSQSDIEVAALTIYIASSKAGVVAQIEQWV